MHTLIVVAHPEPLSLTHSLAAQVAEGIAESAPGNSFEIADLSAEGFDPRFTAADVAVHRRTGSFPADVLAEQARIDRADAVVLVYPVYWWSMPGLLKGWIDRVFSNGWAFDFSSNASLVKKLGHLRIHLIGVGGADSGTYERHGYFTAMRTQIDHGIFGYCGATVETSELLLDSESGDPSAHLNTASMIGRNLWVASGAGHLSSPQGSNLETRAQ